MSRKIPGKVIHGGALRWHQIHTREEILDFSASLNPFPPEIPLKFDAGAIGAYPDDRYETLKDAISSVFRRDPDEITVGNGSVEVIRTYCASTLGTGGRAAIFEPTFGEYGMAVRLCGGEVGSDPAGATVRFLCNPNNPDGALTPRKTVMSILDELEPGQRLFVDEAFIELSDPSASVSDLRHPALFVSRSITKSFAVPGLRFGFGFGDPDLVAEMEVRRLPWTVNACAESFAIAALAHYDALEESRRLIRTERAWLENALRNIDLSPCPSSANYLLIPLPCPAAEICAPLYNHRILVRDCTSFGLPMAIRVAVRTREENRIFVEALSACLP
ncbi:MAG: threonine-phosphate decarboxylase [Methanofollis sp.]|nr:threonine-phosphate decarboxylase [Methanofollis sp.]